LQSAGHFLGHAVGSASVFTAPACYLPGWSATSDFRSHRRRYRY
jgi:hypothetical protein